MALVVLATLVGCYLAWFTTGDRHWIFEIAYTAGLVVAVHQDTARTRMSRWWAFWTLVFGWFAFTIYLYTRNSRGLRN